MGWLRRLFGTDTQLRPSAIETAFERQAKVLEKVLDRQQKNIEALTGTLDRVVASHYDRPVERIVHPQADTQMPLFGMIDQSGAFGEGEIEKQLSKLNSGSDTEFLGVN